MIKNQAGQTFRVFAFTRATSLPLTGDAANITATLSLDNGAAAATNDVNPTEESGGGGYYRFTATQAETNADVVYITPVSATSGVEVIGVPGTIYPWSVSDGASGVVTNENVFATNTISGFPAYLVAGDSYLESLARQLKLYYRTSNGTPITAIGTKTFVDADFTAELLISQDNVSSRVLGTCTWVPASGPTEGYLKVELPRSQTIRASEGTARLTLIFRWGSSVEVEIATQSIEWRQKL